MDNFKKARRSRAGRQQILRWASNVCLIAGTVALLICGSVWAEAHLFQAFESRRFDSQAAVLITRARGTYQTASPADLTAARQQPKDDSTIGKLEISRLGISVIVLQGDGDHTLRIAAGHVPGTALPGDRGNVGIAAHRDTFFRPLRNIQVNDIITIITTAGSYRYQVDGISIVGPERIDVLDPTPRPTLTLVTCYPFYYVGAAPRRFIVRAHQILADSRAAPVPENSGWRENRFDLADAGLAMAVR